MIQQKTPKKIKGARKKRRKLEKQKEKETIENIQKRNREYFDNRLLTILPPIDYSQEKEDKDKDCNDCIHISITEEEQDRLKYKGNHVCKAYRKRVIHRSIELCHSSFIYPCNECITDSYSHYLARQATKLRI